MSAQEEIRLEDLSEGQQEVAALIRELARKYDLTEITIRSIVSDKVRELRARPMDGQLSLL